MSTSKKRNRWLHYIWLFLYSLLPWLIWSGAGFLNTYYFQLNDWMIFGAIILGIAPIFVATKFGLNPSYVFFLTSAYPMAGFIYIWLG